MATVIKIDYRREPKVLEYLASEKWREVYNYIGMMSLVCSKICASSYWLLAVRISRWGWCLEQNEPSCFGTPPVEPWLDPCEPVTQNTLVIFIHKLWPACESVSDPDCDSEKQPVAALIKVIGLSSAPAKDASLNLEICDTFDLGQNLPSAINQILLKAVLFLTGHTGMKSNL